MWSLEQRRGDMWNLSREAGQFLGILLTRTTGANGFWKSVVPMESAIWFSLGLPEDGKIITMEMDAGRAAEARENWKKAGVAHKIQQMEGDANQILHTLEEALRPGVASMPSKKIISPNLKSSIPN